MPLNGQCTSRNSQVCWLVTCRLRWYAIKLFVRESSVSPLLLRKVRMVRFGGFPEHFSGLLQGIVGSDDVMLFRGPTSFITTLGVSGAKLTDSTTTWGVGELGG